MKNLSYIFGLLLLLLYAVSSQATIIVTSIEARRNSYCTTEPTVQGCEADYKLTWRRVPGPNDNDLVPAGIHNYGPMHEHNTSTFNCIGAILGAYPGVPDALCVIIPPGSTWKMVEEYWIARHSPTGPGILGHRGFGIGYSRECVMFAAQESLEGTIGLQVNNGPLVCVGVPPDPDPQCVIEGNPVFNFDISLGQNTSGMQREATINLRCNIRANVTLLDARGNSGRVELGWGYADIKVNGQTLPVNLSPNPSLPLRITATLHGIATEAGVAEGDVVIVVGYQ